MPHSAQIDVLAQDVTMISAREACTAVGEIFRSRPDTTAVAVTDGDRVGLITRSRLAHAAARAGGHARHCTAANLADWHPLRLPGELTAVAAAHQVRARRPAQRYEDVLVDRESGRLGALAVVRLFDVVAAQFAERADSDHLTGLVNRAKFLDLVMDACADADHGGDLVAVAFIDLDGMKRVNDVRGHRQGDLVLTQVGRQLREASRPGEIAARLGGDEFAVLRRVPRHVDAEAAALDLGRRCVLAIGARDGRQDKQVRMHASVGVAVSASCGEPQDLVGEADAAMYRAKQAGGNRVEVALPVGAACGVPADGDEPAVLAAVAEDQLRLHYQPIVRLADRRIDSMEALLRWQHPVRGLLAPGEFLPAAARAGHMPLLDRWVLGRACADLAEVRAALGRAAPSKVNVNISAASLETPFDDMVLDALAEAGLPPHSLRLELPENAELEALATASPRLARLAEHGVRLTLDDMGAGSTNLRYLSTLDVQGIKIDRGFVAGMLHNPRDHAVVKLLSDLGHGLGLRTTAEGVENAEQLAVLDDLGVPYAQGFHLGAPQPLAAVRRLLRARVPSGTAM
ncbi:putative bifunctional diguanylate cyclase/phosphodiesterase [Catellatospora coxensis]|uniref:Diguanylate cyclase (GGDEF)-like protein n=1 Tax=Catellatospora coxensis TaxID=310354 RepID=A0A8J3KTL5_9ACTN|nr:EAL domain-containing protein [Catellatospora coxensis]GIG05983.1 hypothetical protein Cco03nite_26830 [Catellatospora coxensis]